ncbi:Gfo/Idh/MocA family oxidoreductase [Candidatus Poribacteria bacterium]|nr:Gfo/Idh/MocA family oxidoreductase [Candidatus Poribacteria bacterium]
MSTEKVRLAIIGCGGMAGAHLNGYIHLKNQGIDQFDFVAMCDVVESQAQQFAQKAAESQGGVTPKVYTDMNAMLENEELHAADICMPHFLHHTTAIACMEAGVDVIVEKPLAVTVKAGKKMIEAAEKYNRILATAEQVRRWVGPRTVEWAINKEKLIGKPHMFFCQTVGGPRDDPENPIRNQRITWRQNKLTGGGNGIIDGGVHYADLLIYFFGEVDEVYAKVDNLKKFQFRDEHDNLVPATVEDTSIATLTFKNGVTGTWIVTGAAPGRSISYNSYHGSRGSIYGGGGTYPQAPQLQLWNDTITEPDKLQQMYMDSLSQEEKERLFPHGITEGVTIEVYDFIQSVVQRTRPELDGLDGLKAQTICEAIYESSWCGQAVKVADVFDEKITGYQDEINQRWRIW